jgi:RNA polymerase sigma-70 factor (ECF subfamily)
MNYADLSSPELFSLCSGAGDAACWQEFIRRFNPLIARTVLRVAMRYGISNKALVDDLVQETYLRICANECALLRRFSPRQPESAFAFLKVVAANVAQDHFKSRLADKRAPESTADSVEETSATVGWEPPKSSLNDPERAVLIDQIDRKLKEVVPEREFQRDRTVFWLYYRSGLTASAIASLPTVGLTTKGVESVLFRLTRLIRESISGPGGPDAQGAKGFHQAESL